MVFTARQLREEVKLIGELLCEEWTGRPMVRVSVRARHRQRHPQRRHHVNPFPIAGSSDLVINLSIYKRDETTAMGFGPHLVGRVQGDAP